MRFLTTEQKQQHINVCVELRQISSDDATFLSRATIGDESWIFGYEPVTKNNPPPPPPVENQEHVHNFL
jgi:hypothetical protein